MYGILQNTWGYADRVAATSVAGQDYVDANGRRVQETVDAGSSAST
jgi:hypothetical protein